MNTVEIKYTESVQKTKTVEFPYYRRNACFYWKAIAENKVISVFIGVWGPGVETQNSMNSMLSNSTDDSNELQFNEMFEFAMTSLRELNNSPCPTSPK